MIERKYIVVGFEEQKGVVILKNYMKLRKVSKVVVLRYKGNGIVLGKIGLFLQFCIYKGIYILKIKKVGVMQYNYLEIKKCILSIKVYFYFFLSVSFKKQFFGKNDDKK